MRVLLYAVAPHGPVPLPVPAGLATAHELFDPLPLGVYSALRTFQHDRFLGLEHHLERTDRSLELLGWPERLDRQALRRAMDETARAYPGPEAFVRFDFLAAPASSLGTEARLLLALSPLVPVAEGLLDSGVTVRISRLERVRPLVKTARFVLERRPYPLGSPEAFEHLLIGPDGRIREGSSSNFVAVQGGRLRLAGDEALQGVTQRIVTALARELDLAPAREPVALAELAALDEAFLTSSARGIVPIVAVQEQRIGTGRPGPRTRALLAAYARHAAVHARRATEGVAAE
jgi:branched-subunit amino acid aminotransferase/4-amino-4-deoxychorismate lyase